jgi:hypothetical protein
MIPSIPTEQSLLLALDPVYGASIAKQADSMPIAKLRSSVHLALRRAGKSDSEAAIAIGLCSSAHHKPRGSAAALRVYGYGDVANLINPQAAAHRISDGKRVDPSWADLVRNTVRPPAPTPEDQKKIEEQRDSQRKIEEQRDSLDRQMQLGKYAPGAPPLPSANPNAFVVGSLRSR